MFTAQTKTNLKIAKLLYKYHKDDKKDDSADVKKEEPPKKAEPYDSYPPYNFSWFIKNKVAAMGWPQSVENLNYLADVGVDHLITLSPEKIPPILECKQKLKWSEIRVKEFGAPTLKQILKFIEICERAEIRGEVIGVHCRQGRGRTGTMLACYLVYFKQMAPERAVLTVRVQRPGSCETYEQEKIVCHYNDCVRGTIARPDYRLVDDKVFFDMTIKQMDQDDEDAKEDDTEDEEEQNGNENQDGGEEKGAKKKVTVEGDKKSTKKAKAMVINHKIYF